MNTDFNLEHKEGKVASAIEHQTSKLPSDVFLWAAFASIGASAILQFTSHKKESLFVGQWAAPFLLLGIYNKLVKQLGHDKQDRIRLILIWKFQIKRILCSIALHRILFFQVCTIILWSFIDPP